MVKKLSFLREVSLFVASVPLFLHLQGGFGSLIAVGVEGCQIACEAAVGCDSFSYNAIQQQCFLKNGGSKTTCPVSLPCFRPFAYADKLNQHLLKIVLSLDQNANLALK